MQHAEVLGFYGSDRAQAWADAMRLADILNARHATNRLRVRAEIQRGEWVVTVTRLTQMSKS